MMKMNELFYMLMILYCLYCKEYINCLLEFRCELYSYIFCVLKDVYISILDMLANRVL